MVKNCNLNWIVFNYYAHFCLLVCFVFLTFSSMFGVWRFFFTFYWPFLMAMTIMRLEKCLFLDDIDDLMAKWCPVQSIFEFIVKILCRSFPCFFVVFSSWILFLNIILEFCSNNYSLSITSTEYELSNRLLNLFSILSHVKSIDGFDLLLLLLLLLLWHCHR